MVILRRTRNLIFSTLLLAFIASVVFFYYEPQKKGVVFIPLVFKDSIPFVEIEIEESKHSLVFNPTSKFSIQLNKTLLSQLKTAQKTGSRIVHSSDGKNEETPCYLIPKVRKGTIYALNMRGIETNSLESSLNSDLFGKGNLLINYSQRFAAILPSSTSLLEFDLDLTKMHFFSLKKSDVGTYIELLIENIPARIHFSTNASHNVLKKKFYVAKEKISTQLGAFILSEKIEPSVPIDGILGTPFFRENIVYFDFDNQRLYFGPLANIRRSLTSICEKIPVVFSKGNLPTFSMTVEDKSYRAYLDLGLTGELSIPKEVMESTSTDVLHPTKIYNFRGETFPESAFYVAKIQFGNHTFRNLFATTLSLPFLRSTLLSESNTSDIFSMPSIGAALLHRTNMFLDFSKNAFYLIDSENELKSLGLTLSQMSLLTLNPSYNGIIIPVMTNEGLKQFMLDTGASSGVYYTTGDSFTFSSFNIGNIDCISYDCLPVPKESLDFPFDGIIGMDLLKKLRIFINFQEKKCFISKASLPFDLPRSFPLHICQSGVPTLSVKIGEDVYALTPTPSLSHKIELAPQYYDMVTANHIECAHLENGSWPEPLIAKAQERIKTKIKKDFLIDQDSLPFSGEISFGASADFVEIYDFANAQYTLTKNAIFSGVDPTSMIAIPFTLKKENILLSLYLNGVLCSLKIDFSNLISVIKPSLGGGIYNCSTDSFSFGAFSFYPIDSLNENPHVDGILGMDFFQNMKVIIDWKEKQLLISPQSK